MNIHETLNFHELSWTFMNFHEKLFTKLQNHEILPLQGDCAAIEHRCDPSWVKSWNISCSSFYDALLRRWVWSCEFGHGLFLNTRGRQVNYASPRKVATVRFTKSWNLKKHEHSWNFEIMNFHELSWTFMNFHELSWTFMKLCSFKAMALQWSTGLKRV